MLEAISLA